MCIRDRDDSVYEEVKEMNDSFLAEYEALRIATMLDGEYDRNNAIVTLHAGTGGTEACDWTNMLFRMYSRWAQKEGCLLYTSGRVVTEGEQFLLGGNESYRPMCYKCWKKAALESKSEK